MECPGEDVCLGGDENNKLGKCATGYRGPLCGDCADNFSKKDSFKCAKCPPRVRNTIQLVFLLLAQVAINVYLVRGTLNGATEDEPVHSVYNKILAGHF